MEFRQSLDKTSCLSWKLGDGEYKKYSRRVLNHIAETNYG